MYRLVLVSLIYLSLPSFVFLIVWVEKWVTYITVSSLLASILYALKKFRSIEFERKESVDRKMIFNSFVFALVLCLISEFGLSPYKSHDYLIHNYKYYLLASKDLPLFDEKYGINLCYYLGFYIVPALTGKMIGLFYIQYVAFFWIWFGLGLSFCWIHIALKRVITRPYILYSGLCFLLLLVGSYVAVILPLYHFLTGDPFIINNSVIINGDFILNQVPVFTRSFSESTQHALPAILGMSILITLLKYKEAHYLSIIILFSTLFWSPFSTIGLFLFVVVALVSDLARDKFGKFSLTLISYGVIVFISFLPIVVFLTSSQSTTMDSNKFIWEVNSGKWFFYYFLYIFSFWGIWLLLMNKHLSESNRSNVLISTSVFLLLGLVQMGYYNDLNIRATIPVQLVLSLCIVEFLIQKWNSGSRKIYTLVCLFFCVNSLSVWKFYYERFFVMGKDEYINTIDRPMNDVYGDNFYDNLRYAYPKNGEEVVKQYSLREGGVFQKYMLKKTLNRS